MCTEAGTLCRLGEPMWSREACTKEIRGRLISRLEEVHRGDTQHSECPLLATKLRASESLSVSESLSILIRGIRYRSEERGKLTGRNDVYSGFNQSNSGSHFSLKG